MANRSLILSVGAVTLGAATLAVGLRLRRPSWVAVNQGPIEGVSWKPFRDTKGYGNDYERLRPWHSESEPFDFIYKVPTENLVPSVFLRTANGDEVPLKTGTSLAGGRTRAVLIPRNYPPGTSELDLVIKAPGQLPSEFKLLNPPPTVNRFTPDPLPSVRIDGITLDSVAWSHPALGDARPVVAAAIRVADPLPKGVVWYMQVQFTQPFQSPTHEDVTSVIHLSHNFDLLRAPGIGYVMGQEWAGSIPSVRIQGAFATYAKTEEWVNLGPVDVQAVEKRGAMGYELTAPVTLRLEDGAELTIENLKANEAPLSVPKGDVLRVKASIRDPKATTLTGGHFYSNAMLAMRPNSGGSTFWNPEPVAFEWPGGKEGRQSLRLHLTRWRLLCDTPFVLQPKVEHRKTASPRFSELAEKGATVGFQFFPDPEDFSSASPSHN